MTDRAVLFSIKPKYCELIASGKKTVEVRKTQPKIPTPFKGYIYCTKGETAYFTRDIFGNESLNGKVIGEFVCDKIITVDCDSVAPFDYNTKEYIDKESCLSRDDFVKYTGFIMAYGWHISNLIIYDKPKELSEFIKPCPTPFQCDKCNDLVEHFGCGRTITRPPQSWCYVEEMR